MSAFKVNGDFKLRVVPNGDDKVEFIKGKEKISGTHDKRYFDKSKFTKVFPPFWKLGDHLGYAAFKILFKIGDMVQEAKFGHRTYCFNYKSFGFPKATFYRGLSELLEIMVIAKTDVPNQYEINPNFIFNGKRKKDED